MGGVLAAPNEKPGEGRGPGMGEATVRDEMVYRSSGNEALMTAL